MEQKRDNSSYVVFSLFLLFLVSLVLIIGNYEGKSPTGFAVFGSNGKANLTISFNSTNNMQIPINARIWFFANFTNSTDGLPINGTGISCNFTENSSGSWSAPVAMQYNDTFAIYGYNMSFASRGTFAYNITCHGNESYGNISLQESFYITDCVPPASGDWVIDGSRNILCENIPYLLINGSLNVTGNLTVINSTLNSSYAAYLSNLSRTLLENSTANLPLRVEGNSTFVSKKSQISALTLTNRSKSTLIDSTSISLSIIPEEDILIENLTGILDTIYLSSQNFILNLSNLISSGNNLIIAEGRSVNVSGSSFGNITAYSTIRTTGSQISLLELFNSSAFAGNTNITSSLTLRGNASFTASSSVSVAAIGSFSGQETATIRGNLTISGKAISSFGADQRVTRFFPVYLYNGSNLMNGTLSITYGDTTLWQGNLTNSYALVNLTFNSTTYTNQYNLISPRGYMGKISLLDDTPINKSAVVSSIPLSATLLTANGTLFNDTAYIQIDSNKEIACWYSLQGAGYESANKTKSYARIFNGTYLRYNSTLASAYSVMNATELPFLLAKNIFSEFTGSNDNDVPYVEEIYLGRGGRVALLGEGVSPYPSGKNASTYLYFENETSENTAYRYILRFNTSIIYNNFSQSTARTDLLGSKIRIQGKEYNISGLAAAGTANAISSITLSDGSTSIALRDSSGKIQVNGTDIDTAYGYILGTPGRWSGINITYYPKNKTFLSPGEYLEDPVFRSFKITFSAFNRLNPETITFAKSNSTASFSFTNINGTSVLIPYYSNGTRAFRGYNATRPLLAINESYSVAAKGDQRGMLFFFVPADGAARLIELSSMDLENKTLSFRDITYGANYTNKSYINASNETNTIALGSLGDILLNISDDELTVIYSGAPSIKAKTANSAEIMLNSTGILLNENSLSANNATLFISPSYDMNVTYDTSNALARVSKIFGDTSVMIANTRYGSLIEDYENKTYLAISHPSSSAYADVYLSETSASAFTGISGRFTASSNYSYNNLSLYCTDGVETSYFSLNVNISKILQIVEEKILVSTSSAIINVTTDVNGTSSLKWGTTTAVENPKTNNTVRTAHEFQLTGLASGTNFYYNITLCDIYGRCVTHGPTLFATAHQQSNPSSSSWNYMDSSYLANADPFANRRFADAKAGERYSADINYPKLPVSGVEFVPKKDISYIQFRFSILKNLSDVPALSDESKLHSYLAFNLSYADFEDLSEVYVLFRIEKEWFEKKGFDKSSITLNRHSGSWGEIQTTYEKEDTFHHYYRSKVPGFSVFAITATKGSLPAAALPEAPRQSEQPANSPSVPAAPTGEYVPPPVQERPAYILPSNYYEDETTFADRVKDFASGQFFVPAIIAVLALLVVGGGVIVAKKPKGMIQELARKRLTKSEIITELKAKGVYGQSLEEMRQFISASLHQGKNVNEIKAALLSVGWDEHIVDDVFQLFGLE